MTTLDYDSICAVARLAGQAIMQVYSTDFDVECKEDNSPITRADKASNEIITQSLAALNPDIPVVSEESPKAAYAERLKWKRFWLVDPLDGTKEFVKRNGEFAVCIGLVVDRRPVFGALYVPVKDVLYAGGPGLGSVKYESGERQAIHARGPEPGEPVVVVGSRSHPDERLAAYLERFPEHRMVAAGSALKFGLLAEGAAHVYPRFNRTWEWDTAAGHAIILGAGGSFSAMDGGDFLYNKEELLNGGFEARGWRK
ncbi:3'(2'),5'-bisphosphate nucleotidase CysQ [Fundidesulfovibrio terrae]|uniref:3'(2'),5'-bisphosphate nucleotidase CysQ n=1 Tax=Fundidesulfovibrio terrae TaxID=2922866 RepID=UPI001FB04429|nr:3'(2'),5'-bisphosphate nucleotidase CysQ [Fundidesulfovibrio terrae]